MKLRRCLLLLTLLILSYCKEDRPHSGIFDRTDSMDNGIVDPKLIQFDAASIAKTGISNPGGVVSCWLMDSDIERPRKISFADAMKDMGVKYIRFPYGHLADNYLWDADGDWGNTLTPKVATKSETPGNWDWAVDSLSRDFIKDMDFDEYISICKEVEAEPMVVVNIMSYKYTNGPSYEELKESAVEWVRYANVVKGYNVKRWALGNEVDHHPDVITLSEYKVLYSDFAAAMKAVDPTIMVGPGLLGNWFSSMLKHDPGNIDFICAHNYLYNYNWRLQDYEGWKNTTDKMVNNIQSCQSAVNNSSIPDIEIHATEMNSRPWSENSDSDDLFRALAYGEMLMNAVSLDNVVATYVWNTHGPWSGPDKNVSYNVLDLDNERGPRGDVIKLINDNISENLIKMEPVQDFLRIYATINDNKDELTIFIINKNDQPNKVVLKPANFNLPTIYGVRSYYGSNPFVKIPVLSDWQQLEVGNDQLDVDLPALSMNIIKLKASE